jgi:hypothetical protein
MKFLIFLFLILLVICLTGCMKSYDVVYHDVDQVNDIRACYNICEKHYTDPQYMCSKFESCIDKFNWSNCNCRFIGCSSI